MFADGLEVLDNAPAIGRAEVASGEMFYIVPNLTSGEGMRSNVATLGTSGLDDVMTRDNAPSQYFDLLGRRLPAPQRGVTVRLRSGNAEKILQK